MFCLNDFCFRGKAFDLWEWDYVTGSGKGNKNSTYLKGLWWGQNTDVCGCISWGCEAQSVLILINSCVWSTTTRKRALPPPRSFRVHETQEEGKKHLFLLYELVLLPILLTPDTCRLFPSHQPILQRSGYQCVSCNSIQFWYIVTTQSWGRPHRIRAPSHRTFPHFWCQSQVLGLLYLWPAAYKVIWESTPITSIF